MKRKALSLLLALALCFGLLGAAVAPASASVTIPTQQEAYQAMIALKSQYPEGMGWTNADSYRWKGGPDVGFGCAAFAFLLSDAAFGTLPARMVFDFDYSDVKVGDILRINNQTHSVIVLEVNASGVVIAEGNYNSKIHWGRTLTKAQVLAADYMWTRYPLSTEDTYEIDQGVLTGYAGPGGVLTIPSNATEIGDDAFFRNTGVTQVTIPGNVSTIGRRAFYDCMNLTSVTMQNGVTEIGDEAFRSNTNLVNLTIPNSVTKINYFAFGACSGLKSLTLPSNLKEIGASAFSDCTGLTELVIPSTVTEIGSSAFQGCTNLTKVTIPSMTTHITGGAFYRCDNVTIYGLPGSYAETFAKAEGIPFQLIPDPDPNANIAYANTITVLLDGEPVVFQAYALKDSKGGVTNYVKLRDLAYCLNGTKAQFEVEWSQEEGIVLTNILPYTPNGSEMSTPFSGDRVYRMGTSTTWVNRAGYYRGARFIPSIILKDDNGGDYTYYQLRDMGYYLGFNVSYINRQVVIDTSEPYSDDQ